MKKKNLLIGLGTLCLVSFATISCGGKKGGTDNDDTQDNVSYVNVESYELQTNSKTNTFGVGAKGAAVPMNVLPLDATKEFTYVVDNPDIITLDEINGTFEAIKPGKATITAISVYGEVTQTINIEVTGSVKAKGGFNYQALDYEGKAEVIGKLEGWAMDNHLTGITLFQNGGYILYNNRLQLGADEYIPGFGYGNLSDGKITKPAELVNESQVPEYKMYYHTILTSSPANINYLNSQGEVIGDLYGYISTGLWNTKMNASKDGYEWYPVLAKGELEPVKEHFDESTGLGTVFNLKVKTGKDGLVYRTLGKRKEFDKRPVVIDDYVNAYKQLLTKANKLSRGAELTSLSSEGTLAGASAYYNLSSSGVNDEAFKNVGIKALDEETLQFTLAKPTTPFYAKYSLASSLTQPFPEDFVDAIGDMKFYGAKNPDDPKGKDVQDNILCLGPYLLEKFDNKNGGEIIFKLNEDFIDKKSTDESIKNRYNIPGIHNAVREGLNQQTILSYFDQGVIDACGIPQDKLKDYIDKPECHRTLGDSTFKLNVNSSTQKEWDAHYEQVFKKSQNKVNYEVKPIMSNDSFLKGLNESINRKEFAESVGAVASQDYFGGGYLYDPEEGKAYNDTIYHKANLATRFPETFGFNYDQAVLHFKKAVEELVSSGAYTLPCTEEVDIWWMNTDDTKLYGKQLEQYIEKAFNDPAVSNGKFTLDVVNHDGTTNYEDVYNKHLQVGNFDLGFGSISGNALNPLNFMEVLKSDNSSGFTLNWGRSTAEVDPNLVYDGKSWSFDSLWTAANSGAVISKDGLLIDKPLEIYGDSITFDKETKSYKVEIAWKVNDLLATEKGIKINLKESDGITYITKVATGEKGMENVVVLIAPEDITFDNANKKITFYIKHKTNAQDPSVEKESNKVLQGMKWRVQLNYTIEIDGIQTSGYVESKDFFKDNDFEK